MTLPNFADRGDEIFATRRVDRGQCRLVPHDDVVQVITYLAAFWANRYGIELLALTVMSNHFHYCVRDPLGLYSEFATQFHAAVSRTLNLLHELRGHMWKPEPPTQPRCLCASSLEQRLLYTTLNPVRAGIIRNARRWPGTIICPEQIGRRFNVERPAILQAWKRYPAEVEYIVAKPSCYAHLDDASARRAFATARRSQERQIAKARNNHFTGLAAALAIPIEHCFDDPIPKPRPRFVASEVSLLKAAHADYGVRVQKYERAKEEFRTGKRDVRWPRGTIRMHIHHKCPRDGPRAGP